ncbi:hypothetical protein G9A89_001251 [Geosiphon pyriformis]|nr:hypothetical protein G9A89_001251 [Geosiphon pyriformis]
MLGCTYNYYSFSAYFKLTPNGQLSRNEEKDYGGKSNITDIYPLNSNYLLVEYGNQAKIFLWNGTLLELKGNLTSYPSPFATTEGGFGYAYIVNNSPIIDSPSINITRYSVYVTFWEPEITDFGPHFLLFQYGAIDLSIGPCDVQIDGLGYYCYLELRTTESGI